jgi:glutamyl-tRNA synthetase
MVEGILDGLRWLGLDWDEGQKVGGSSGPYFQSERLDRYRAMAAELVARGAAYYCYCSTEELKARREAAEQAGGAWRYDRTCSALSADEVAAREREGRPRAIRVRVPEGSTSFTDLVRGAISFDGANIEDFIILRSDGHPTYQLSVVSDDVEMRITHVVRGDDHISNTPKQLILYRALGAPEPKFAHVPLILGPDKKRLSKRHGATSVTDYAERGYLPEAMTNFLALLGWSPGSGDREIFSRDELSDMFDLAGISGGNAVFNTEKLDWFNQQYLARLAPPELARRLKPYFEAAGLWQDAWLGDRHAWFFAVLELLTPRAKRLTDYVELGRFFFTDAIEYDAAALAKHVTAEMRAPIADLVAVLPGLETFDVGSIEGAIRSVAESRGVKASALIHTVRVALTGRTASPGLFEVAALLGRDRAGRRLTALFR